MPTPQKKKKNTLAIVWTVITVLILIFGSVTAYIILSNGSSNVSVESNKTVTVPKNLKGLNSTEISAALRHAGLVMELGDPVFSDTVDKGLFVSSSPAGGSKVPKGSVVVVHLSAGPEEISVPDLQGLTQDEAIKRLTDAKLVLDKVVVEDNGKVEKGKVIRTNPPAGQKVAKDTKIQLMISSGRISIPSDLIGQSKDAVLKFLSDNGLSAEIVNVATNQSKPDSVISITPTGVVDQGQVVKVVVATDPGPSATTLDNNEAPSTDTKPNTGTDETNSKPKPKTDKPASGSTEKPKTQSQPKTVNSHTEIQ